MGHAFDRGDNRGNVRSTFPIKAAVNLTRYTEIGLKAAKGEREANGCLGNARPTTSIDLSTAREGVAGGGG